MIAVCQGAFDAKHVIGQDEYEDRLPATGMCYCVNESCTHDEWCIYRTSSQMHVHLTARTSDLGLQIIYLLQESG